jgi:hypothetical protein
MLNSSIVRIGLGLTATAALLAGGPALAQGLGIGETPVANMPVAWEAARQVDADNMADSHTAALKAEKQRKAAERRAKEEARRKAEAKRRAQKEKAARSRAAQGGTPAQNRALGMQMCANQGWSASQCADLGRLWAKESGWNARAHNGSSGAHGIPQALPGSKMSSHGPSWATNPRTQIAWGLDYIKGRYGNPSNAWAHSINSGWY